MDNNANNQPVETPMPNMQIPADNSQMEKKGTSPMWIILTILIVVALAGGVYLYTRNQGNSILPTGGTTSTSEVSFDQLTSELNSADTTGETADLNQLDKDLQEL